MKTDYKYIVYLITILGFLILSFMLLQPYFTVIIFSAIVAYLLSPVYKKLAHRLSMNVSAVLITLLLFGISIIALRYGLEFLLNETVRIYMLVSKLPPTLINTESAVAFNAKDIISFIINEMIIRLSNQLHKLPGIMLSFVVFFISFFYFLRDGHKLSIQLKKMLPLPSDKKSMMFKEIKITVNAYVYVQLVVGLIQGLVGGIGFYIFGLPYPLIAGIAMGILSFLPIIGPYLIYLPVGVISILQDNWLTGIGIIIYGVTIMGFLDYVVRPQYMSRRANIHPLIVLLGFLGGMHVMGAMGIIIGPILLSIAAITIKDIGKHTWAEVLKLGPSEKEKGNETKEPNI